jgi:NadR type nicotinamide-nucleotide adenylyltransferase
MEKNPFKRTSLKRILVTGPESTGKTDLVNYLAERFHGCAVKEYARGYVEQLGRQTNFEDVEHIARQQASEYEKVYESGEFVFFDTWLIITRVWFDLVYGRIPGWLDHSISEARFDLVLLCAPDIPWIADGTRENGGVKRELLFDRYKKELTRFSMDWELVTGHGDERIRRAEQIIINRFYHVKT